MAATNPTINGHTLVTGGNHSVWQGPDLSMTESRLNGVLGSFVQRFPNGAVTCLGSGTLASTTPALLKAAIRTIQNDRGHAPVQYTDVDASTHDNCILVVYRQLGSILKEADDSFWCNIVFAVRKQQQD